MTSSISVSLSLFNIAVSSYWSRLWFASWNRNGQSQEEFGYEWKFWSWAWSPVEWMSVYLFHSLCSPSCHPVLVEDPHTSSHMGSSAFQGVWQPARHSEDPLLMFQRSAARLFNFSASVARGAKAPNCCLEILSSALKKSDPLKCSCAGPCNPVHI